jgi:gamma-glutamyl-gamma-aminobutyrate hydrolase PuuD
VWSRPAALVPQVYVDAVTRSGGVPLLLPPGVTDESVLDVLDGLLVIGGADVDPAAYGAEPHPATAVTRPERDEHERRLLVSALDRGLPLFGVCRGAQLLTVAVGGLLHQHLPDLLGHEGHRPEPGVFGTTTVTTEPGTLVAGILGERAEVPCYHHQGLAEVCTPLVPTARAGDGLVEAVELPGGAWVLGVQWHPEENADDLRLFEAFVAAAGKHLRAEAGAAR